MTNTIITEKVFPEFKKQYESAVSNGLDQFNFHGQPVLTSYAKYLIEYIETKQKEKQGHGINLN